MTDYRFLKMKLSLPLLAIFLTTSALSQESSDQSKNSQFNFWIGEWDVFKYGTDTLVGYSQIESILNGLVIKETYKSSQYAFEGTSLSKYNQINGQWEQYWVDNSGTTLHIKGAYSNKKMTLSNTEKRTEGTFHNRLTWTDLEGKAVRQMWEQSNDGEKWVVVFDGHYKPKK